MTAPRNERALLLLRAGLEIVEDFDGDDGTQSWGAWPSFLLEAGWFTVVVPAELPDLGSEVHNQWQFWARHRQLFDETGTFLIDILTGAGSGVPGRGMSGRAVSGHWTRVRLSDRWDLAGVLGPCPGRPDFVTLSTDGTTVISVTSTQDEVRLRILDRVGERRQAAARTATADTAAADTAAAPEPLEQRAAAAWEGLFQGDDPSPALRKDWANGLALNPSTPVEELAGLLGLSYHAVSRAVPRSVVEAAMAHPDFLVHQELAQGAALVTPEQWSRMILGEQDERRRFVMTASAAEKRTHLTSAAYSRLASDPSARIRGEAAELAGLPLNLLTALAADPEAAVRRSACRAAWPHLDAHDRRGLLADPDPRVRRRALLRHHLDHPLSRAVFEEEGLGAQALSTCRLECAFAEHLVGDDDPARRRALAENRWLPPDLVQRLSTDPDPSVRSAVALRGDLTEEQRGAIDFVFDLGSRSHALDWVVALHDTPRAMRRLAASPHPLVRRSVARARHLPPDVAELLSHDDDRVVQLFLAESCDDAPAEMLLRVWTWWTGSLTQPGRPRTHPRFPRRGLLRFAADPDPRMRQLALDDPESSPDLVDRFSQDDDAAVRLRAAADPRLGPDFAVRLLRDSDRYVRHQAAGNPQLPAEALVSALRTPDTAEAAAGNPALPISVVRRMMHRLRTPPTAADDR